MQESTTKSSEHWLTWLALIGLAGAIAGLVTSPAVTSVGTIVLVSVGLGIWPLVRFLETRKAKVPAKTLFVQAIKRFWAEKTAVLMVLLLLMHIVGGLYTWDQTAWMNDTRVKLPLLLLPLVFTVFPAFSTRQIRLMAWILILSVSLVSVGTAVNYYLNRAEIDALIAQSQPMPIFLGVSHIYLSFILAYAVIVGVWLFRQSRPLLWRAEKWIALIFTAGNLFALHLFTARTGLVAFYLALGGFVLIYFLRRKKYLVAVGLILAGTLVPITGYFGLSSLRNRVDNTVMDIRNYINGGDPNYLSVSMRMEAMKTAWHIFEEHPWMGTGVADLETEMENQYIRDGSCLISRNWVMPHNQFLLFLAGMGVIGGLLFLLLCVSPWLLPKYRQSGMFLLLWILMMAAMLAESLLERQVGVTFFVLFWFLSPLMDSQVEGSKTSLFFGKPVETV